MSNILLSFCIPTYYRANFINKTVNHLLQYQSNEIEIIASDNASPDNTESLLSKIKDPRFKYNRNKRNLGYDLNLLKCIEMASGKYLFFLSDDDIVELKEISWILEIIKNNDKITQILGSVGDTRIGEKKFYIKFNDEILNAGESSLVKFGFSKSYAAGTILKKKSLDLEEAKKFIGFNYMHLVLMFQSMISGNTLCTSKILSFIPKNPAKTRVVMLKGYSAGKIYYHPLSRISQTEFKIKIIEELLKKYPKAYNILLNYQKAKAIIQLADIFYDYPSYFLKVFLKFIKKKEFLNSPKSLLTFLVTLLKRIIYKIYVIIVRK